MGINIEQATKRGRKRVKKTLQVVSVEETGGLLEGKLGHAVSILNKDIFKGLRRILGDIQLNTNKTTNANLLVHHIITGKESVRVNLVAETTV